MQNFFSSFWAKFKTKFNSWSLTRKIVYGLILLLVAFIVFNIVKPKDNSANTTTDTVKLVDLQQTILATGQVTSNTDLDLSFRKSGVVRSVRVKVGDKVQRGQVLATLDQGPELAALTQAKASVKGAQAKYDRLLAGASSEEIQIAEIALENAERDYERVQAQQETLVSNAYNALLNSTPTAVLVSGSSSATAPTISGTYTGTEEGEIIVTVYGSGTGTQFSLSGIASGIGSVSTTIPQELGDTGLYILFSSTTAQVGTTWSIKLPNTKASTYLTNYNAYQAAIKTRDSSLGTAQALIDQREAELILKRSEARQADVDLALADILSAEGNLQLANSNLEDTILRAPASGTITKVDIKLGELAKALEGAMVLQDIENVYLEANINEANIVNVVQGASIDITFDAFGTENLYKGNIVSIDPSSTIISGVVNYKITANIENPPTLRPGMTANMTILVAEKNGILVVPGRAILKNEDGSKSIRVVTNTKTKAYREVGVETGLEGDGGLVEIISGLNEGEEIVVLIRK